MAHGSSVHGIVVLLVAQELIGVLESGFWLLDVDISRIIWVLVSIAIGEEAISDPLVEVIVMSHPSLSELLGNLSLCDIENSQKLVATSLCEPNFDKARCWNEAIKWHDCKLEVVRPEHRLLEV